MFKKIYSSILFVLIFSITSQCQQNYAVSIEYTPVLNTSDFQSVFGGSERDRVKLDDRNLIGEMEFIAFPNTVFEILESYKYVDHYIYKVISDDYPYKN